MEGPELCRMWAWCRMMNCQQNVYSLRAVLKANQWAELHKKIIFISRSKWYSRLPFTALKPFVLNIYCKFGEAVTVLSVTHGYSEVCCKGSGGNDGWMFSSAYGNIKAPCNGKCYLRKAEAHKLTAGHTHTHALHTQTIVPSWFDVSHSESHFYLRSQISINTGLDCCEKIAAGLVPTHLCEPLRALWIDYTSSLVYTLCSPPHLLQQTAPIFTKTLLQIPTSAVFTSHQLYFHSVNATVGFNIQEEFWNCFFGKLFTM